MQRNIEATVLIVGAGPVGLSLATDLAWRGTDVLVAETKSLKLTLGGREVLNIPSSAIPDAFKKKAPKSSRSRRWINGSFPTSRATSTPSST